VVNRRGALAAALLAVGVLGVLSPLAFFEFHEERRAVSFDRIAEGPANDSEVVSWGLLPERTTENLPGVNVPGPVGTGDTVAETYGGFTAEEWRRAVELRTHEYLTLPTDVANADGPTVRTVNRTYTVTPRYLGATSDALYALVLGPVALVLGALLRRSGPLFPLNERRAAVLAGSGFAGVLAYRFVAGGSLADSRYNGSVEIVLLDGVGPLALAAGAALGFVAGAGFARGNRRLPAALALCSLFLPGATGLGVLGLAPGAFVGFLAATEY